MGYQAIAVGISIGLTLITTLAFMLFERRRYLTNNPNAMNENFSIFREPNCPICFESMDGPNTVIINCGHSLHEECLAEMNRNRDYFQTNRCPICRTPIRME